MKSLLDVTQSTEEEDSSEEENNEENKEKSRLIPFLKTLNLDIDLKFSKNDYKGIIERNLKNIELETDRKLKLLNRPACPDDSILVQLASLVYNEKSNGEDSKAKELLVDWTLLTTAYNEELNNGYFGAAYWNPEQQQIVVAHRGTIWTNIGALWTDFHGILREEYTLHMASAITFAHMIKIMVEELNKRDNVFLQLSFTGHSLGGWLAQITTLTTRYFSLKKVDKNYLFVKSKKVGYHAHTVAFDSPGCKEMLLKIIDSFEVRYGEDQNKMFISNLDITIYLSAPNLVNTCHSHTGTLYQIFIENPSSRPFYSVRIHTLEEHSIESITNFFTSPRINEMKQVVDWPLVNKGIIEGTFGIFNGSWNLIKTGLFKLIGCKPVPAITNEYKDCRSSKVGTDNNDPQPNDNDGYCEIRYQVEKVDKKKCSMSIFSKPELLFLNKYMKLRNILDKPLKNVFKLLGDEANTVTKALKHCKIEKGLKVNTICCNSEVELKELIRYVKYTIRFFPQITKKIKLISKPTWFEIKKLVTHFIGRTEQLGWTHSKIDQEMVVITGLDGVGKSELATTYVRTHYDEDDSVVWIDAENEETIKNSFSSLLEHLNLKPNKHVLKVKCVYDYLTVAKSKRIIFIFDNAENYTAIKDFLPSESSGPKKVYVLVTSSNSLEWKLDREIVEPLTLKDFPDEEAIQFVKKYLNISHEDRSHDENIKNFIQKLCKFPIALKHVVNYINMMIEEHKERNSDQKMIKKRLNKYLKEPRKILSYGSVSGDSNNEVLPHFNQIIDKIQANKEYGKQALYMLDIISYFAPSNIPEEIFLNKLANGKQDDLILITLQLKKYSIVDVEKGMLNVHGLVQQNRKYKVKKEKREEEILKNALLLITEHTAVCGHNQHETDREKMEREKKELYAPHIVSVWNHAYKYMNLIEKFLLGGRQIKIPGSDIELSFMHFHFHFIAAGSKLEIIKKIMKGIEKMYSKDHKQVKNFINARNNDEECALYWAAKNGKEHTVNFLIRKGADVNAKKSSKDVTLLHMAVLAGEKITVQCLLKTSGIEIDAKTTEGNTALHLAAKKGNLDVVKVLMDKKADASILNNCGQLAWELADNNNSLSEVKNYIVENSKLSNEPYNQAQARTQGGD